LDHGFRKPETDFQSVNSFLNVYWRSIAFGSVPSFFGIKGAFFSKTTRWICAKFFQDLENTCPLQPALKSNARGPNKKINDLLKLIAF